MAGLTSEASRAFEGVQIRLILDHIVVDPYCSSVNCGDKASIALSTSSA